MCIGSFKGLGLKDLSHHNRDLWSIIWFLYYGNLFKLLNKNPKKGLYNADVLRIGVGFQASGLRAFRLRPFEDHSWAFRIRAIFPSYLARTKPALQGSSGNKRKNSSNKFTVSTSGTFRLSITPENLTDSGSS